MAAAKSIGSVRKATPSDRDLAEHPAGRQLVLTALSLTNASLGRKAGRSLSAGSVSEPEIAHARQRDRDHRQEDSRSEKRLGLPSEGVYAARITGTSKRHPGAGGREMRELPPAKEEEHDVQGAHSFQGIDLSPQGINLPRSGCLRGICGGSGTTPLDAQIMARSCRERRLA
jgi:hypothetical protein